LDAQCFISRASLIPNCNLPSPSLTPVGGSPNPGNYYHDAVSTANTQTDDQQSFCTSRVLLLLLLLLLLATARPE